jgi:hypothetical protein
MHPLDRRINSALGLLNGYKSILQKTPRPLSTHMDNTIQDVYVNRRTVDKRKKTSVESASMHKN